ncbi:phosphoribosylformylglycinamidine synthase [Saccharicrinis fermentans DSM 9555 = JCM 21142]|uniref:Phosphoribosylformylglycinamidine synthase n=1 Tax=Saccharicrinis fermentans DSM 9555 = JCM 21142 TaxID=869213 RepID=W7Y967_9BACT|nr:phosphoribosylformylglycinamidine synthase [Saccharicrinis fermentans DSM 9555 = JCM 21142]
MVLFFKGKSEQILAVGCNQEFTAEDIKKLEWLFSGATKTDEQQLGGFFVGPRKEMITPWSTNAVEITQNMGLGGITRIEEFFGVADENADFDPMLQVLYNGLGQDIFTIDKEPDPIVEIDDVAAYNQAEGLALSDEEVAYLDGLALKLGRKLTDSEVFGFSQVNSEHCRHKIFNGTFIIDGEEKESSLFKLIKRTSQENPNFLVSAYKDNVAFVEGPKAIQFAPKSHDKPDFFETKEIDTVLSLKAETHNFPTTVEPFNGAATGSGGEIRDRLGGGKASLPLAGTAVYMTSYSRSEEGRAWEGATEARPWLYQTPEQILIKASNGASDFGNKFGQPMICGSVLTFEHFENQKKFAFDKVIMMAGGIGFAKKSDALKDTPDKGDKVVILGGDNYRIGMGGGAVSSVATGEFDNSIELNAVQRSNPEMQKRAMNAIRAMAEGEENPIVLIHDHGAGGHLNCLSELVEETGGTIHLDKLPVGDPTLSAKEIAGNESQERMGLVIKEKDIDRLKRVADRERSPMYVVGETTGDMSFVFKDDKGNAPINWQLSDMFGNPPKTIMNDVTVDEKFAPVAYDASKIEEYLKNVLQLEAVACKDWLTNKVDRSVTGKVAKQQCVGEVLIPLNNLGATSIDYTGTAGLATSVGHAPAVAMIDPAAGSRIAIAESLTNLVWAPFTHGIKGVSLSANWMWPCKNKGEDARLYKAVEAVSDFATDLGINIPTGKDSLSMTQKYKDGEVVYSPGTVIISVAAEVSDVKKIVEPVLVKDIDTSIIYIDLSFDHFKLGGSSFAQVVNKLGDDAPNVSDTAYFKTGIEAIQSLVKEGAVVAGHDISAGGMVTALLEMCFANHSFGIQIDLSAIAENDLVKILFAENPGVLIQVKDVAKVTALLDEKDLGYQLIGKPIEKRVLAITKDSASWSFDIDEMRDVWYKTSYLLDRKQCGEVLAKERYDNYKKQALKFSFSEHFNGQLADYGLVQNRTKKSGVKAAIIREKGVNGDREMAYSMYLAGFDVKDVHMTDLITGRETLEDVSFIVFVGGFSNSDVLGSAKGCWCFLVQRKSKGCFGCFLSARRYLESGCL